MISNLPVYPFFLPPNLPILSLVPNADNVFQWVLSKLHFILVKSDYGIFAKYPNGICIPYSLMKYYENKKLWYNIMFSEIESCIQTWKGHQCHCGFCSAYVYRTHTEFYLHRAFRRLYIICSHYTIPVDDFIFALFPNCGTSSTSNHTVLPADSVPILSIAKP